MKKAIVDVTVRMLVEYHEFKDHEWDADSIEFHLNESSRCADNSIGQLSAEQEEHDEKNPGTCGFCHRTNHKFVRWLEPGEDEHQALVLE